MHQRTRIKLLQSVRAGTTPMHKEAAITKEEVAGYLSSVSDKGVINLISPSVIGMVINKIIGGRFIGWGVDFILRMFGIDFEKMLTAVCEGVKSVVASKGQETSPKDVSDKISETVDSVMGQASKIKKDVLKGGSVLDVNKEIRIIKLACTHYQFTKKADAPAALKGALPAVGAFLKKLFTFVFTLSLRSAGMQLFTDVVTHSMGLPSGFDFLKPKIISTQTKFKRNPNFADRKFTDRLSRHFPCPKDEQSVKLLLIDWTNKAYLNVDQSALQSSPKLEDIAGDIIAASQRLTVAEIFVPETFSSIGDVVDSFIDDVAAKSK